MPSYPGKEKRKKSIAMHEVHNYKIYWKNSK